MESTRWQRIQELFHAVADLPAAEQQRFLASACSGDDGLMADVRALLDEDARGSSPLDRGVAEMAEDVLAPPPAAKELGPYRIRHLLGEGGMGVVYLAERQDIGSLVAIKLLSHAWLSPARLSRFAAEQRMLAQLDHPAIARIYDAGALDDGTPFFVMEYVDGKPLTEHCRERSATVEERLRLFRSLCEAVQFAHRHAIIHRDVKPSNVLVKRDGTVRLLDFGIAKHLEHLDAPATQTGTGMRLMTPAYAAPEQLTGDRVGIYTDVYSLGVVLYELLTDRLPFDRSKRSPAEAGDVAFEKEPDRPSIAARGAATAVAASKAAWADLDVLVMTAMRSHPGRRYGSVEALIRDVDHYLSGEPLEARPDSFGYRLRKFVTRNRRAVLVAGATFALVIGLVGFFTARLATARNAELAQAARRERIQKFMTDLLTGGGDVGPGKELRVVTLLDRGAKQARTLDADPELQADLFHTLGTLYLSLGELDSAESFLVPALDKRVALRGETSGAAVESMGYLALLRDVQGRYDEAEKLFRKAFEIGRQHLPASDERAVMAAQGLGRVLTEVGRFEDAMPILTEVVKPEAAAKLSSGDLSDTLTLLAHTHIYLGHYAEADSIYRRVQKLDRERLGDKHPSYADDLNSLGMIQFQWGHYPEAEDDFRKALAIREAFYGRDNPETADSLTLIGRVLIPQGKLAEAAPLLAEALQIDERAYGKVHARVGVAVGELGNLAVKDGRLDDAEALYRRQAEIFRALFGEKHFRNADVRMSLGGVAFERKDYGNAERLFREALAGYRDTLPRDHPKAAIAEIRLGEALVLEKRYAEAEPLTRAGYEVLAKASPDVNWVRSARADLVAIYDALGQPEKASRFRGEPR